MLFSKLLTKKFRIILIAMNVNLLSIVIGTFVGWTSPVLPKLRDRSADSPLNVGVSIAQEGWISSLSAIGCFAASLIAGALASRIGRKWTLHLSSIILVASFILLLVGTDIGVIYVARFLQGFGGGFAFAAIPMYVGEIATDDTRGIIGSFLSLFMAGGILYVYVIGPYVSYAALQYCCLVFPLLFTATFIFMPDTPYYFAIKGQKENAFKSLQTLRGQTAKEVETEMTQIQSEVDEAMTNKNTIFDIVTNRVYMKAILITCGLMAFQQLSGIIVVTFNSQSIFASTHSNLDPAIATIIIGIVEIFSSLFTPFVVERFGRKIILLISSSGMFLCLTALGTFFYIQEFGNVSKILWLPLIALISFHVFFGFGYASIPWVMLGEMFPANIKPFSTSIACATSWTIFFVIANWFPELNAVGPYYVFWMFSASCCLAIFFVLFVVVETRGLSLQQIQDKLQRSTLR